MFLHFPTFWSLNDSVGHKVFEWLGSNQLATRFREIGIASERGIENDKAVGNLICDVRLRMLGILNLRLKELDMTVFFKYLESGWI